MLNVRTVILLKLFSDLNAHFSTTNSPVILVIIWELRAGLCLVIYLDIRCKHDRANRLNIGPILGRPRRRWAYSGPALGRCVVFVGYRQLLFWYTAAWGYPMRNSGLTSWNIKEVGIIKINI